MKSIGTELFAASLGARANPKMAYERLSARDLQLRETWFRDAIFDCPEIVIGPCREAGRVDDAEVWMPWGIEKNFGAGPIDVLLLSSYGRVGLVETKLSYNPQKRREVVAQVLDYALSLQERGRSALPDLPQSDDCPDEDDLVDAVSSGKFLLLIAGDSLDPRALRLSEALLARHLTNEWDLGMVDINLFRHADRPDEVILVPELLGLVRADVRQVVRVQVEGQVAAARVTVERIAAEAPATRGRKLHSPDAYLHQVAAMAPDALDTSRLLAEAFMRRASAAPEKIQLDLETRTLNLYAALHGGRRARFLTLWPQGRLVILFRYLTANGQAPLVDALKRICGAVPGVTPGERKLELEMDAFSPEVLLDLIHALCDAVEAGDTA